MIENYLQVLEESLHKKMDVLCRIELLNQKQEEVIKNNDKTEEFDTSIDSKSVLIDELDKLDEGFEKLYENIREQLLPDKEKYNVQIAKLQVLINDVMDKSVSIQAQEARNNKLAEGFFSNARKELQQSRRSSKVAMDYYRNMNQSQAVAPQFMDKKK